VRATASEAIELLDLSSRLRKVSMSVTIAVNGWQVPTSAQEVLGMPSTLGGKELIAELLTLRSRLLSLSKLEPPEGMGWAVDPLAQAAEASRLCGFINDTVLERRTDAAAMFRQARRLSALWHDRGSGRCRSEGGGD
jgi:hypothetical protein